MAGGRGAPVVLNFFLLFDPRFGLGSILGGVAGAYVGGYIASRVIGKAGCACDAFAPAMALAMSVGRIGDLLAAEDGLGKPTSLPWGALQFGKRENLLLSKVLMAAGVGHLSFAFLRLALVAFYRDNLVWFAFWEEATEFLLIAGLAAVLYIFRRGLAGELALPFTVPPGALRVRM